MDDENARADGSEPAEDLDTGEPIEMLRDLAEEPAAGFLARIRNAIQRRALLSQFADLSWFTPVIVLFEYVGFFFGIFEAVIGKKGDTK